jgi:1-acyl-sn-glycerol-3-phosphate acyltransferase
MRHDPTPDGLMGRPAHLRAAVRGAALLATTVFLALAQLCAMRVSPSSVRHLLRHWHRACGRILDMDVRAHGAPDGTGPVIFVCNHASYLDVPVLGGLIDARFVAKSEVAGWPVIGALSRLQGTIFIERRLQGARSQPDELRRALRSGDRLVLFPEGTSSDGNRVLAFKSTLFAAADEAVAGAEVKVQPVTIAYSRHKGLPMGRRLRPHFAWYGDMTLVDHLWACLGIGGAGVDVVFHEPVRLTQFASRKALARHCQGQIARGLSDALSGRMVYRPAIEARPSKGQLILPVWLNSAVLETGQEM